MLPPEILSIKIKRKENRKSKILGIQKLLATFDMLPSFLNLAGFRLLLQKVANRFVHIFHQQGSPSRQ